MEPLGSSQLRSLAEGEPRKLSEPLVSVGPLMWFRLPVRECTVSGDLCKLARLPQAVPVVIIVIPDLFLTTAFPSVAFTSPFMWPWSVVSWL